MSDSAIPLSTCRRDATLAEMHPGLLAKAESIDLTASNLTAVFTCAVIVLATAAVALVPLLIAWSRRSKHAEAIAAFALVWALCTILSTTSTALAQMKYSRQHLTDVQSGYLDPQDTTGAPQLPWLTWVVLGVGYAGLLAWPLARRDAAGGPPEQA